MEGGSKRLLGGVGVVGGVAILDLEDGEEDALDDVARLREVAAACAPHAQRGRREGGVRGVVSSGEGGGHERTRGMRALRRRSAR